MSGSFLFVLQGKAFVVGSSRQEISTLLARWSGKLRQQLGALTKTKLWEKPCSHGPNSLHSSRLRSSTP